MSREIPDSLSPRERLIDTARIERQLADQLAVCVDHADVQIGDEELDDAAFVGAAEADFVEL